ncbi:glycoside hydrolase family 18 protein [Sclerotinia borealis F-4128]|uniref:chitinase n=1 Tax=Sclerotinia borealis (strain F-4128) TaxID=1432307 RepID=W9C1U8_SCLBF|nr:glycoside hydrolase family 18 protein [Sclerotinia borealis F-4128]
MLLFKRLLLASTCLHISFSAAAAIGSNFSTRAVQQTGGYQNTAYYVNWAIYDRKYEPQNLPASQLTRVLYSFANLRTDGSVYLSDTWADLDRRYPTDSWNDIGNNVYGCIKQLYILKKHNRQMKTLLSIGGWTWSSNFPAAASTDTTRARFAATAVQFVQDLGFDGIDIDWEYPANDVEARNFVLLLQAVRSALDAYSARYAQGYHFLITVACPAGPKVYNILHLADMDAYVDSWNLMAYDYAGSWDNIAGHQANLYPSVYNAPSTPYSTQRAITDYIAKGISASKIIMGLPLYGREFGNTAGFGLPYSGIGAGQWDKGVWDYNQLPKAGATEHFSSDVVGAYSYDSIRQVLVSYDNVESTQTKAKYIIDHGLGGAMFWEASADRKDGGSLIGTTAETFPTLDTSQNLLTYSASAYQNLAAGMPGALRNSQRFGVLSEKRDIKGKVAALL